MRGLAILLGFHFAGLMLHDLLHVPLPGSVLGMILFTACLFMRIVKLQWVECSAQFLLKHMAMFFVPLIVGTMVLLPVLGRNMISITAGVIGSTLVTLAVTGWVTSSLAGERNKSSARPDAAITDKAEGSGQVEC